MSKFPIILNSLSVIVCLVGLVLIQSEISFYQEQLEKIDDLKSVSIETEKKLIETKKESSSKILRQKSRNQDLQEEISDLQKKSEEIQAKLINTKEKIEEIENSIKDAELELSGFAERKNEANLKLQASIENLEKVRNEIPKIEQQINSKRFEIDDFNDRANSLEQELTVFSQITDVLRSHFLETLSAIRAYERKRPWLEPGEQLSARLNSVDIKSGYIALSVGGASGLREGMVLSAQETEIEVSRIRIKKVFRTYALGEVIPLVGNPLKLPLLKKVDLVVL